MYNARRTFLKSLNPYKYMGKIVHIVHGRPVTLISRAYRREQRIVHREGEKRDMREKIIERYLKKRVEETGLCLKWVSPGAAGVPDRVCIFPGGRVVFVETKAPTGTVKKIQKEVIRRMRNLGAAVYVASTKEDVDQIIRTEAGSNADF